MRPHSSAGRSLAHRRQGEKRLTEDSAVGKRVCMKHSKSILAVALVALALTASGCFTGKIKRMSTSELQLEYVRWARIAFTPGWQVSWGMGAVVDSRADAQRRVNKIEVEFLRRREAGDTNAVPPDMRFGR